MTDILTDLAAAATAISQHIQRGDTPFDEKAKGFDMLLKYAAVVLKERGAADLKPKGATIAGFRNRLKIVEDQEHDDGNPESERGSRPPSV